MPFLDLTEQYAPLRDEIEEAIERVVESQYFILGPEVEKLEEEVAAYLTTPSPPEEGHAGVARRDSESKSERVREGGEGEGEVEGEGEREGKGEGESGGLREGERKDKGESEGERVAGREGARKSGGDHPLQAIGCASGTDAILLPLMALREGENGSGTSPADFRGDVVLPAFTFFATAGAVWNAGFRPVFCDVDPETFNVTRERMDAVWTDDTRAVIPVHLFGQMAPMEEITGLARDRNALVIEDAAQAIGADRDGHRAGTVGDCGAFSFFPTKNLGGFGDGGMITTPDPDLAERLRKLRVHGGLQMYHHEMVGTNSRLDALQAAVLRVKLPRLDRWAARRRENARAYDELLSDIDEVRTPVTADRNRHTYNQYTLRVEDRDGLREFLSERRIGSGLYYPVPLHLQDCFRGLGYEEGDFPVAEELCRQVVSLPIFPELGRERIEIVTHAVREYFGA